MAYYAFLNDKNIVTEVITGVNENELIDGLPPEIWYGEFRGQVCKRTSYHGNIRGIFAGVGFFYHETEDIFITPRPFPSWIRDGSIWLPPIPYPEDGQLYFWDEENQSWVVEND
jgi:hypothetical protein